MHAKCVRAPKLTHPKCIATKYARAEVARISGIGAACHIQVRPQQHVEPQLAQLAPGRCTHQAREVRIPSCANCKRAGQSSQATQQLICPQAEPAMCNRNEQRLRQWLQRIGRWGGNHAGWRLILIGSLQCARQCIQCRPHIGAIVKVVIGTRENHPAQVIAPQNLKNCSRWINTGSGECDKKQLRNLVLIRQVV